MQAEQNIASGSMVSSRIGRVFMPASAIGHVHKDETHLWWKRTTIRFHLYLIVVRYTSTSNTYTDYAMIVF